MPKPIIILSSILIVTALSSCHASPRGPMSAISSNASLTLGDGRIASQPAPALRAAPRITPRVTPRATRTAARSTPVVQTAVTRTPVATVRGGNSADARQAIETYARDQLGIAVKVLRAGSSVVPSLSLSTDGQSAVDAAAELAATTYGAVLSNGSAGLSFGSGTISGDIAAELDYGSLGAFAVSAGSRPPTDAAGALSLLQTTFPALSSMSFQPLTSTQSSYAFYATVRDSVLNPKTHKVEVVGVVALMGTSTVKQKAVVWVVLGRGQFVAAIPNPD